MIHVTDRIRLNEADLEFSFVRSSGPGGQNVNKVATAVQLRFDAAHTRSLPPDVRERLIARAGARVTRDGILLITARRFRTQERNRADAVERLVEMIRAAARRPTPRRKTKKPRAAHERRIEDKRRRSTTKRARGRVAPGDD